MQLAIAYKNGSNILDKCSLEIPSESTLFNSSRNISHIYKGIPLLTKFSSTNIFLIKSLNHVRSYIINIFWIYTYFLIIVITL